MYRFKLKARVNGMATEEIVAAMSLSEAEKLFRAKYPKDARISFMSWDRIA